MPVLRRSSEQPPASSSSEKADKGRRLKRETVGAWTPFGRIKARRRERPPPSIGGGGEARGAARACAVLAQRPYQHLEDVGGFQQGAGDPAHAFLHRGREVLLHQLAARSAVAVDGAQGQAALQPLRAGLGHGDWRPPHTHLRKQPPLPLAKRHAAPPLRRGGIPPQLGPLMSARPGKKPAEARLGSATAPSSSGFTAQRRQRGGALVPASTCQLHIAPNQPRN